MSAAEPGDTGADDSEGRHENRGRGDGRQGRKDATREGCNWIQPALSVSAMLTRFVGALIAAISIGAAAARANDPTWHLSFQAYSFHEHTSEIELHNTT